MATKAQKAKAEEMHERALQKPKRKSKRRSRAELQKPHNLGERAGRTATVAYEASAGPSSRKSTRRSANHQRAANPLERTQKFAQQRASRRAETAQARTAKVRGKSRPV